MLLNTAFISHVAFKLRRYILQIIQESFKI